MEKICQSLTKNYGAPFITYNKCLIYLHVLVMLIFVYCLIVSGDIRSGADTFFTVCFIQHFDALCFYVTNKFNFPTNNVNK